MANNSILGQMLEAAVRNGGLRGASGSTGAPSGAGGLGDLLGQVLGGQGGAGGVNQAGGLQDILGGMLGGGASSPNQAGAAPSGGGLGDILGQVLGGTGQGNPRAGGQTAGGSLQDILGGILGGQGGSGAGSAPAGGGLGDILGGILGGASGAPRSGGGATSQSASEILRDFGNHSGSTGNPPPVSPMPETPSVPRNIPSSASVPDSDLPQQSGKSGGSSDLVKYGGIAILGMLAYKALKNRQAGGAWGAPPSGQGFLPDSMPGGGEAFSGVLIKAMIAAMQADGVIDADEQRKLIGQLDEMGASESDRRALAQQLSRRIDPAAIVAEAKTPEMGLQIYMASALAITVDTPAERAYLDDLARRLDIDPGLKGELERTIGRG